MQPHQVLNQDMSNTRLHCLHDINENISSSIDPGLIATTSIDSIKVSILNSVFRSKTFSNELNTSLLIAIESSHNFDFNFCDLELKFTVFPRLMLRPHNLKQNFGNKYHLAHVKTFLTYNAYVKVK
ncbi:hypothetical protein BpHYR1_030358 [Brachionus plicatilis]|uniref:Uncharacterized protein n=1 Tax=Brachionus plicatilis TaxID=10195 RepID=A0A3M7RBS8_BRAPC|nr:hypothetical protein BpHYR1_030358 [Brachionus plicatilis]